MNEPEGGLQIVWEYSEERRVLLTLLCAALDPVLRSRTRLMRVSEKTKESALMKLRLIYTGVIEKNDAMME
jgi:hypothetical protein